MLATVIDIETSTWNVQGAAILSYAYITFETDTLEVVESDVRYLYENDKQHWTYDAFKIHGLSKEFLKPYAGEYSDNLTKLYKLTQKGIIVSFNGQSFDVPFIGRYFSEREYPELMTHMQADMMRIFKPILAQKKYGLMDVVKYLKIPDRVLEAQTRKFFPDRVIENFEHHQAEFDVAVTFILYRIAKQRGYLDGALL